MVDGEFPELSTFSWREMEHLLGEAEIINVVFEPKNSAAVLDGEIGRYPGVTRALPSPGRYLRRPPRQVASDASGVVLAPSLTCLEIT